EVTQLADAVGDRLRGLHFYDGHIHAETKAERKRQTHALYDQLLDAKRRLEERGHSIAELVTSGTPTFLSALAYPGFQALSNCQHRVSPGTVVFHDMQYDSLLEDLELAPAAMVFTRIISHPADDIVTCDAGSKSLACEAGQPVAVALGHPTLEALGPSEEHLPMRVHGGTTPARGTELLLVPRYVCPTVNLAERAVLVEADGTYQVCEVAARAHDLMFPME
nr:D-TA family PLP-dependent enzyme [Gammaproteobacteria bacterium]